MTSRLAAVLSLALPACVIEADLGSQPVNGEDPVDEQTGDPVSPDFSIYDGGASSFLVDGADLVMSGGGEAPEDPAGILRLRADGGVDVIVDSRDVGRMVEDADRYYVTAPHLGQIIAIDKTSLAPTVLSSGWDGIEDIAVDAGAVYFGAHVDDASGAPIGKLVRVSKDGTNQRTLIDGMDTPMGIDVDADFAYVAEDPQRILAVPRTGGPALALVSGVNRPSDVLVVGEWLYFTERGEALTDGAIGRIRRPTRNGEVIGVRETLVVGLGHPTWLAVDATHAYWTGYFSGLQRAPLDGGAAEDLLSCIGTGAAWDDPFLAGAPLQGCGALAVRDESVVFSAREADNTGRIYAVPK